MLESSRGLLLLLCKQRNISSTILIHIVFNLNTSSRPSPILCRHSVIPCSWGAHIVSLLELVKLFRNFYILSVALSKIVEIILLNLFIASEILWHDQHIFISPISSILLALQTHRHLSVSTCLPLELNELTCIYTVCINDCIHSFGVNLIFWD